MNEILVPKRSDIAKLALLGGLAVGGLIAQRFMSARKVSAAERLAEALLDTEPLRAASRLLPDSTEKALSQCASYLVNVAYRAAEGLGVTSGPEDPVGYSRTHTHPYTGATATVLTEDRKRNTISSEEGASETVKSSCLTYAVTLPETGEVRGTRTIGGVRPSGISLARPTPETVQISLKDGYTAQIETEFEVADSLVTGQVRIFGAATMRDNHGNVGRLNIAQDGLISGTITREARVIGRFEGHAAHGLRFQQYMIEKGD
jgi:hypothetical protein